MVTANITLQVMLLSRLTICVTWKTKFVAADGINWMVICDFLQNIFNILMLSFVGKHAFGEKQHHLLFRQKLI